MPTLTLSAYSGTTTRKQYNTGATYGAGNGKRHYVGRYGYYDHKGYLKFNLATAGLWAGVGKIISATLTLYNDDGLGPQYGDTMPSGTPKASIRRLASAFSEGDGNASYVADNWTNPTVSTAHGEASTKTSANMRAALDPTRFDVTAIVRKWAPKAVGGSAATNYGFVLYGDTDSTHNWAYISEDAESDYAAVKPSLTIEYAYGATAPDAPTDVAPSGAVVAVASFAGDFTDTDPADKLHTSHVQVTLPSSIKSGHSHTDDTITMTAHGFKTGTEVWFTTLTGGAGLSPNIPYYVKYVNVNTFTVRVSRTAKSNVNITDAHSVVSAFAPQYNRQSVEGNTAVIGARFDHVPDGLDIARNTNYYWRSRVKDTEGSWSAWAAWTTFSISNTVPDAPTLDPGDGATYASLDGVSFSGTFGDDDTGDYLLAYQVQLSAFAAGASEWDDPVNVSWDTGKRYVSYGDESWTTPYGGASLAAGTYYWRARVWDQNHGVSLWSTVSIILSADFVEVTDDSVNAIQMRPRAPWRIVIKAMAMNAEGGDLTGVASTDLFTTSGTHGFVAGRRVRFSVLHGGTNLATNTDYYVIASGLGPKTFRVSATDGGGTFDFASNVTTGSRVTAVTSRGPGATVAVLEDVKNVGASLLYNSPGEAHWTMAVDHPQLSAVEPKQTHYSIQMRQGDGWREVFAGLVWDIDASDRDVIVFGLDYLALLDRVVDERFKPTNSELSYAKGGSKYNSVAIKTIIADQLETARGLANSPVKFISVGTIASVITQQVTVYSTYSPVLTFIAGLLDSHRAGRGKFTRIQVRAKTGGGYEFVVTDDPGTTRDNLRLRFGELVQGYRVVPFGTEWASTVAAMGRDKDGLRVRYTRQNAPGIDQAVWGRFVLPTFIDGISDATDLERRARQMVTSAASLGKQMGLGMRSGVLQPRDGYDLLDRFPIDIEHGAIRTSTWGHDGLWVCTGITWQALQRGDFNTTLTLAPKESGSEPSADLLVATPISTQDYWQRGYTAPDPLTSRSTFAIDSVTGIMYSRDETATPVAITGTAE